MLDVGVFCLILGVLVEDCLDCELDGAGSRSF